MLEPSAPAVPAGCERRRVVVAFDVLLDRVRAAEKEVMAHDEIDWIAAAFRKEHLVSGVRIQVNGPVLALPGRELVRIARRERVVVPHGLLVARMAVVGLLRVGTNVYSRKFTAL